jgi:DNA-directed RNA polymerase subunit RPC12/RpoP
MLMALVYLPLLPFVPSIGFVTFAFFLLGLIAWQIPSSGEEVTEYEHTTLLQCAYCAHMNPERSLRCLNCGAPIHRDEIASEPVRIRRRSTTRTSRVKCPHCGSVYSYNRGDISKTGEVKCQNCLRPLRIPDDKMPRERIGPKVPHRDLPRVVKAAKRLTCTHCGASYLYLPAHMSDTGLVRCQNCGKHFRDPNPEFA